MSMDLRHEEIGWLDRFAEAAMAALIPAAHEEGVTADEVAEAAYRHALSMIDRRRTVLREEAL